MTTIAYRDGWLVADGQATRNGVIIERSTKKIVQCDDGTIIAFTGDLNQFIPFVMWYHDRTQPRPPMRNDGDTCTAVVLTPDGKLFDYDEHGYCDVNEPFAAWGSGGAIALAAMACGKNAFQAIEVAALFDVWTGGEIIGFKHGKRSSDH